MTLWALIQTGGWVMIPLFVCSLAVWAVCLERLWTLRRFREKNREFLLSFTNFWLRGDKDGARKLCEITDVELSDLAREFVDSEASKTSNMDTVFSRVERKRLEQSSELKKFLWVLGTIGSAAPFIGLFGTVVGIIKAFQNMAITGQGGFTVVAAGISEALVATATGIIVAVIAVFFYNYLQVKVGNLQFQFKLLAEELIENVTARTGKSES